jgi:hypothetical protein
VEDPQKDNEEARKQRAKDLRKSIDKIEEGVQPANRPLSPREITDRAAEAKYEQAKEKSPTSRPRKPK